MNVELDTDAQALYLRLAPGRVADHRELADFVVANEDATGGLLGIEFVQAEDFGPFVLGRPDLVVLPSRLAYRSLDRGRSWEVETGADAKPASDRSRINAEVNGAFVASVTANPALIDRLPGGATVIPFQAGMSHLSNDEAVGLLEQIARAGGTPVLQPLGIPAPPERTEWHGTHVSHITGQMLSPRWPAEMAAAPPLVTYFRDTDLLVLQFIPGREALPVYGRVIPVSDPLIGVLLVDLETQAVIGHLFPRFVQSVLVRRPATREVLAQATVRDDTPPELIAAVEDLGLLPDAADEAVDRGLPVPARTG